MSKKSWLKAHYPVDAVDVAFTKDDIAMVKHAIQKWKGLLPEALEKHEVELSKSHYGLVEKPDGYANHPFILIDNESCAFCVAYLSSAMDDDDLRRCVECPLYKYLGDSCDSQQDNEAPFSEYIISGDPEPMIAALEGTLKMLEQEKKNE